MFAKSKNRVADAPAAARAMDELRRMVRVLRSSNAESEREAGITAAQLFVLKHIADNPGTSLGSVVSRTLTAQSAASEVVARLVARGLVSRSAASDDRRRAVLSATAEGVRVVRSAAPPVQERLIAGLSRLPRVQQEALADGLAAWLRAAGVGDLAPSMFFEPEAELARAESRGATSHTPTIPMRRDAIEPYSTVNEVLLSHPETTSVFNTFCIDACCGGNVPLASVAQRHGIDLTSLLSALRTTVVRVREAKAAP